MGFLDRREESLMLNQGQERAVLSRLLNGRDDQLYQKLYGVKYTRCVHAASKRQRPESCHAVLELNGRPY